MRNDLIELLALLVSVGYIKSFRVTKNYIYVTMKNDRQSCSLNHSDISALKLLVFYNNFRKKASVFTRFSENCYFFVPFCFLEKDKKAKITLFFGYDLGTLQQKIFNQSQDFSVLLP